MPSGWKRSKKKGEKLRSGGWISRPEIKHLDLFKKPKRGRPAPEGRR